MTALTQPKQRYTYGDYTQWPSEEQWELIEGVPYAMTASTRIHQKVVLKLSSQIDRYLEGKGCEVYIAPFDVRLPQHNEADESVETTVQPDLAIICDPTKLDDKGCRGAPDWIIEVLSPSTALKDMDTKRWLYEKHGVREYWIVHPTEQWLMIYVRQNDGNYGIGKMYPLTQPVSVGLFPDLAIEWGFLQEQAAQNL